MNKALVLIVLPLLVSGCSRFALGNNSLDYQKAAQLPPLTVPAGVELRRQTPLYPVPPVQPAPAQAPKMTNSRGNRYVLPPPLPLDTAQVAAQASADTGIPTRPMLVTDGNGFPLLRSEGNAQRIWQLAGQALKAAALPVQSQDEDRGLIALTHQQQPVTLRFNRSGSSTLITVQSSQNTLAEAALATDLLTQIAGHWPQ